MAMNYLADLGIPQLLIGRSYSDFDFITTDAKKGIKESLEYLKEKSSEIYCRCAYNGGGHATKISLFLDAKLLAKLSGWYVSEGSLNIRRHKNGNIMYMRTAIAKYDMKNDEKGEIKEICEKLNIKYTQSKQYVAIHNDIMYMYFEHECGNGSYNKKYQNGY